MASPNESNGWQFQKKILGIEICRYQLLGWERDTHFVGHCIFSNNVIYSSIIQIILPSMNNSSFVVHAIWVSSASDVAQPHIKTEFHPKKHMVFRKSEACQ